MNFERLTSLEVDTVLHLIPAAVQAQIQWEDVVLAGGAIRDTVAGLPVKDIDIFCHSEEQAERLSRELADSDMPVRKTLFAYSVELAIPVQYVFYKDFTDALDLVGQFDFRACCAGIYWEHATRPNDDVGFAEVPAHWEGIAVDGFHADCRDHALRFMSQPKDNGKLTALGRALHLANKGWTLSTSEAANIIAHFEPSFEAERVQRAFRPGYGGAR